MITLVKKFNSLQGRVIAWILIAVVPIFVLTSIWVYLFLSYFYHHYTITPLALDTSLKTVSSPQPFIQETLIAWSILFVIICIYIVLIGIILNKRMHKLLKRLDFIDTPLYDIQSQKESLDFPIDVLHVLNSIATTSNETQQKLNQYQQINADMTHELRSPLHTIGLAMESIQAGLIAPTPQMFAILYNEVQRIHRLVEDMRTLSLIDIHKFPLYRQPTQLHAIVQHVVLTKSALAQQNNIHITTTSELPITTVLIDADRIMQVLSNIIDNAIRHSKPLDTIAIHYVALPDMVTLTIRDSGTGIAACDIPHLFTRFYRGTSARGQGSGLGLAIAHAIITAHRGTIAIDSILGQGTTVTIQLPREYPTQRNNP
jgi:two-component system sensor histidine kinase BaeS